MGWWLGGGAFYAPRKPGTISRAILGQQPSKHSGWGWGQWGLGVRRWRGGYMTAAEVDDVHSSLPLGVRGR